MVQAVWKGSVSFGLLNVPVKMSVIAFSIPMLITRLAADRASYPRLKAIFLFTF
jgi:non-homologous end joining protein Ku